MLRGGGAPLAARRLRRSSSSCMTAFLSTRASPPLQELCTMRSAPRRSGCAPSRSRFAKHHILLGSCSAELSTTRARPPRIGLMDVSRAPCCHGIREAVRSNQDLDARSTFGFAGSGFQGCDFPTCRCRAATRYHAVAGAEAGKGDVAQAMSFRPGENALQLIRHSITTAFEAFEKGAGQASRR